jgi:hypothetical protein
LKAYIQHGHIPSSAVNELIDHWGPVAFEVADGWLDICLYLFTQEGTQKSYGRLSVYAASA